MKPGEGIRTPLNYTGNKSRLVSQFRNYFPKSIGTFVDLFCGGATVGLSANASKVIFVDNNQHVIALLQHLATSSPTQIISRLEKLVEHYGLSYSAEFGYQKYRVGVNKTDNNGLKAYNSEGYYKLREDYNQAKNPFSVSALDKLYLLVVYGFNNDMRFNKLQKFNLPVGKTDLNKSSLRRLEQFHEHVSKIKCQFICADFRSPKIKQILDSADFIYADPPYLIGRAVYNEAGNWTNQTEQEFIELMEYLRKSGKKFAVSNVIAKKGHQNSLLSDWLFHRKDMQVHGIDYHYRSASYNKLNRDAAEQEVLITNYAK